jgi:hypothetical protein
MVFILISLFAQQLAIKHVMVEQKSKVICNYILIAAVKEAKESKEEEK